MARPLRIQYPEAWYHVMNRGRRAEAVFLGIKAAFFGLISVGIGLVLYEAYHVRTEEIHFRFADLSSEEIKAVFRY